MLSDTVHLLPGNGDGTFQAVTTLATVPEAYGLEVADVTADGVADLVVTSLGSGAVALLVANGDGTVQPPARYPTGDFPWSVTVGDVTGDSLPDLVVPNRNSGTVRVLRNQAAPPRTIAYTYDGLNRLTGATETPGTTYAYSYDLAGNRTTVRENGTLVADLQYNDANQVIGWSYDAAGNLLSDGTITRSYDALNRLVTQAEEGRSMLRPYAYNGDGVLVSDGTTTSVQDLAAPLSQVLSDGTATYVYGHARLRALGGPWYVGDALGSVRQILDDAGGVLATTSYDPWGTPQGTLSAPFGFTGELHSAGQVYLRARWYAPGQGRFVSEDPFAGFAEMPYSLHAYQYAYSDPVRWTDPTGWFPACRDDYSCRHTVEDVSRIINRSHGFGYFSQTVYHQTQSSNDDPGYVSDRVGDIPLYADTNGILHSRGEDMGIRGASYNNRLLEVCFLPNMPSNWGIAEAMPYQREESCKYLFETDPKFNAMLHKIDSHYSEAASLGVGTVLVTALTACAAAAAAAAPTGPGAIAACALAGLGSGVVAGTVIVIYMATKAHRLMQDARKTFNDLTDLRPIQYPSRPCFS